MNLENFIFMQLGMAGFCLYIYFNIKNAKTKQNQQRERKVNDA